MWRDNNWKENIVSPCLGGVCIKSFLAQNKKILCAESQALNKVIARKFKKAAWNAREELNLLNHT